MFSKPPTVNMRSAAGQTTSEPSSPVDLPQSFHRHRLRPRACPANLLLPHLNFTSQAFHVLVRSSVLTDELLLVVSIVGELEVYTFWSRSREGSRESTDTNQKFFILERRGTPSKKHPPMPKEQTDAYLRTKMVAVETGEIIPVPGLGVVDKLLSSIWDAVDDVGSNQLACLRLTTRCTDFLLGIYDEVHEQGDKVKAELDKPLKRLESSFTLIFDLMVELRDRPFWKRLLSNPGLFEGSQDVEPAGELDDDGFSDDGRRANPRPYQNELDKAADMTDLHQLLSAALNAKSNDDMQRVAGKDMPTAIRMLLMILEGKGSHWKAPPSSAMRSTQQLPHTRWEAGECVVWGAHIAAVQRLVQGYNMNLPSWTIGKSDIVFQKLIGRRFFSNVCKGTWRHRSIAIKVLERSQSGNRSTIPMSFGFTVQMIDLKAYRGSSSVQYLKRLEWDGSMVSGASMVSEISRAMEYMRSALVVHGDIKISHKNAKHAHGLRWQSPELMAGHSFLTKENDVYAFGIIILFWKKKLLITVSFKDRGPSGYDIRPVFERCWNDKVMERPTFSQVVKHLECLTSGCRLSTAIVKRTYRVLCALLSSPSNHMYASKSSVAGQTESFSKLQ
ncbi:hypothetical protein BT96DRAFT_951182 [Gymnopus androsaceus JB14]|uniref:Protein kinase domain-containing protein n=1 Tax=Gymnopus androsaceus JB14 TaxID=1447944 RepID=A0A6A4GDI2_9AGAR|nr:hypothetical protein BT96DRAFT_951182 [Gymnopus androsaceus JB14]